MLFNKKYVQNNTKCAKYNVYCYQKSLTAIKIKRCTIDIIRGNISTNTSYKFVKIRGILLKHYTV